MTVKLQVSRLVRMLSVPVRGVSRFASVNAQVAVALAHFP
jgi:hypothetical protein